MFWGRYGARFRRGFGEVPERFRSEVWRRFRKRFRSEVAEKKNDLRWLTKYLQESGDTIVFLNAKMHGEGCPEPRASSLGPRPRASGPESRNFGL